ncbi:MAG: RluA family pseudouridine synthase [Phycisphaerales bacterium]
MNKPRGQIQANDRVTYGVRYQDDDLLVVEKPPRVVTQPGVGHEHDTLLNGLFAGFGDRLQQLGVARDFGLVHRLDRETSGLLVVALSARGYDAMRGLFESRDVSKYYWAICHKAPKDPQGVIKKPIAEEVKRKDRYTSIKFAKISSQGKPAVTAYRVLSSSELGAVIEARPVSGRLHQVRVHLDLIGSAVLGDPQYGPQLVRKASPRLALHAHRLVFEHPLSGEKLDISTRFPRDLKSTLRKLRLPSPDEASGSSEG